MENFVYLLFFILFAIEIFVDIRSLNHVYKDVYLLKEKIKDIEEKTKSATDI